MCNEYVTKNVSKSNMNSRKTPKNCAKRESNRNDNENLNIMLKRHRKYYLYVFDKCKNICKLIFASSVCLEESNNNIINKNNKKQRLTSGTTKMQCTLAAGFRTEIYERQLKYMFMQFLWQQYDIVYRSGWFRFIYTSQLLSNCTKFRVEILIGCTVHIVRSSLSFVSNTLCKGKCTYLSRYPILSYPSL